MADFCNSRQLTGQYCKCAPGKKKKITGKGNGITGSGQVHNGYSVSEPIHCPLSREENRWDPDGLWLGN